MFAAFAASLTFDMLPLPVVEKLKEVLLDTLGVAIAGSSLGSGIDALVAAACRKGEPRSCTILGVGQQTSTTMAALVNGALAHTLNFDDSTADGAHLGAGIVPVLLALAEERRPIGGREFLVAMAAGAELGARLGEAVVNAQQDRSLTRAPMPLRIQLWGYFAGAAAGARLLGLDAHRTHQALGAALMQAAGNWQSVMEAGPAKIYTGFSSIGALISVLIAEQGIGTGSAVFDGEAGLFASLYSGNGESSRLVSGLGQEYSLMATQCKPWPTSGVAHPFIEAAIDLLHSDRFDPADIVSVELQGGLRIQHHCEPLTERRHPENSAAASDGLPYLVAVALSRGTVGLADLAESRIGEAAVNQLADAVSYRCDPSLGDSAMVDVLTSDGGRHRQRVDVPIGCAGRPMGKQQIIDKFRNAVEHASNPIPPARAEDVVALVERLDELDDVITLLDILHPRSPRREQIRP